MLIRLPALALLFATLASAGGPETRLVPNQPTEGRFVKTKQGFMVPYEQRIPGSNAVIEMVPIPGGSVLLGPLPPPDVDDDNAADPQPITDAPESKPKTVSFGPFWIGKCEITMQQYLPYRRLYYRQKKAEAEAQYGSRKRTMIDPTDVDAVTGPTDIYDPTYNFEYAGDDDSPVPTASQFATRQYTKWLSLLTDQTYRLPLRGEWQHACLAGSHSKYSFGDDEKQLDEFAVYFESRLKDPNTLRVRTRKPNAWGLYDMHGNVSEFVIEDTAKQGLQIGHVACGGNADCDADQCRYDSVLRTTLSWWDDDPDFPISCWWMTSEESRAIGFRIISPLESMTAKQKRIAWDADSEDLTRNINYRLESGRGSVGRVSKPTSTTRRIEQ